MSFTARRLRLAKGFLLDKMYHLGYFGGKHTGVENLPKGCPAELRAFMSEAVKDLRREGLLAFHPTDYGEQVNAIASPRGYGYANIYEKHYGLSLLVYGKPTAQSKVQPLSKEELHALKRKKSAFSL